MKHCFCFWSTPEENNYGSFDILNFTQNFVLSLLKLRICNPKLRVFSPKFQNFIPKYRVFYTKLCFFKPTYRNFGCKFWDFWNFRSAKNTKFRLSGNQRNSRIFRRKWITVNDWNMFEYTPFTSFTTLKICSLKN
jgi:hypothetical protein